MRWRLSWSFWVFSVAGCAIFLLPKAPFYQTWMPYGYELGGLALVMLYLSLGFWSLGFYGVLMGGLGWKSVPPKCRGALKMGIASLGIAVGLGWCYVKVMTLMVNLWR